MKYVVVFTLVAVYLLSLALLLQGWAYLLLWPCLAFALLALAYAGVGPRVFGKRSDGKLAWWSYVLFFPVLVLLWTIWHLQRAFSREVPCHEIIPGLWLGRRPLAHELPPQVQLVVDLTSEFPVARGVRTGREYLVLPTLDGTAPPEMDFLALAQKLASHDGISYIHCAAGRGRSAALVAAILVMRGLARDVRHAEEQMRTIRPGVRLTPPQRRLLARLFCSSAQKPTQEASDA